MVIQVAHPEFDGDNRTVIGIDSSSTGIAWTVLFEGNMLAQGKIELDKIKGIDSKLAEVYKAYNNMLTLVKPDFVFVERSIFVKNPATARTLSYIVGTIIAITAGNGIKVHDVDPSTWKAFFKYKNIKRAFVDGAKRELGNAKGSKLCEEMRKSQTWRVIRHNFNGEGTLADTDNDIADSWGIALWGYDQLGGQLSVEITDAIRLDLDALDTLGLKELMLNG